MLNNALVLFDMTRLLARRNAAHPTGIDRVDLAYADELRSVCKDRCLFITQLDGALVHVEPVFAKRYIDHLLSKWRCGTAIPLAIEKEMAQVGLMPPPKPKIAPIAKLKGEDVEYIFSLPYKERLAFVRKADLTEYLPPALHWFAKSPDFFRVPVLAGATAATPLLNCAEWIGMQIGKTAKLEPVPAAAPPSALDKVLRRILRGDRGKTILYVNTSHHGIDNIGPYLQLRTEFGAEFVFFIHDLIPIQFPEYVRPGDEAKHANRMRTIAKLDPLVICNSLDTQQTLANHFLNEGLGAVRSTVAHIGLERHFFHRRAERFRPPAGRPYFVALGTLEIRKNHLLLLNLWRELATGLESPPVLYLVGRRGWENQSVFNMLDRCAALRGHVFELPDADDNMIASLMVGARALLFPTFAEGWGMPLVEAQALGAPAICSDLPVLREASQDLAQFIDPLDYTSWKSTILDYMTENSEGRRQQVKRLRQFRPPTWEVHFSEALTFIDDGLSGEIDYYQTPVRIGRLNGSNHSVGTETFN